MLCAYTPLRISQRCSATAGVPKLQCVTQGEACAHGVVTQATGSGLIVAARLPVLSKAARSVPCTASGSCAAAAAAAARVSGAGMPLQLYEC